MHAVYTVKLTFYFFGCNNAFVTFDTNCCRRLTTKLIQDVCQVSSVTVCFNPRINARIKLTQSRNPGIAQTGRELHSILSTSSCFRSATFDPRFLSSSFSFRNRHLYSYNVHFLRTFHKEIETALNRRVCKQHSSPLVRLLLLTHNTAPANAESSPLTPKLGVVRPRDLILKCSV